MSNGNHVKKSENARSVFAESFHPFVQKYSNDIVKCAERIIKEICYKPYSFEITADTLKVDIGGQDIMMPGTKRRWITYSIKRAMQNLTMMAAVPVQQDGVFMPR